ncbi:MAG: primase-helicase family protein [Akkermansiaceae bacterium]|jgi:energy-coupling factor transporter ATP-binding protein EcfA2
MNAIINQGAHVELQDEAESPALKFFYDGVKYYLDTENEFVPMDQQSVSRHLRKWGCDKNTIEDAICEIQTERHINYAGALAGHPRGLHFSNGSKLLATTSPKIIEPSPATWATIAAVVEGLLYDHNEGKIQIETFYSWLKVARESLVSGRRRPGQALALAGRRGCGKSLLIDLIELILGQRRANPYAFFTGKTNFNADLAGAELLAVDDEAGSSDIRSRKNFAANIKSCLFSGKIRVEAKHRCAFTFAPVWRMVIALNDEPEALLILPPMTEDIKDKIHLFHCQQKPLPMPAHTLDEREAFFTTIKSEIPAFLYWLENYEIPQGIREERCGVTFYHNPAVLNSLEELSPEGQLLSIIDTVSAGGGIKLPWEGTAAELKLILCSNESTSRDALRLLDWTAAMGTYLGRLEGKRVERLALLNGIARWRVDQVE